MKVLLDNDILLDNRFPAPTGHDAIAQGNALGYGANFLSPERAQPDAAIPLPNPGASGLLHEAPGGGAGG
ncbi:MAG: hypothetical protein V4675_23985 [Verrucomicrobiota bacterium]